MSRLVVICSVLFVLVFATVFWAVSSLVDTYVECRQQSDTALDVCLLTENEGERAL